jgi:hypothetical protein
MSEYLVHDRQNKQGRTAMSTVEAAGYIRRMVERETAGNGDVENAVKRLARKHGLSFWQIMHLRAGRAKSITVDAFAAIRKAYVEHCEAEIRALQREIDRDREQYGGQHDLLDLGTEIAALAAKVQKEKQRMQA